MPVFTKRCPPIPRYADNILMKKNKIKCPGKTSQNRASLSPSVLKHFSGWTKKYLFFNALHACAKIECFIMKSMDL